MSNGKIIVKKLSRKESKTDCSTEHQYSAISVHSSVTGTPEAIEEWLMSSREARPVSRLATQENERVELTVGTCGPQCAMSSESSNPSTPTLKTSQAYCLQMKCNVQSAILQPNTRPQKRMEKSGICFARLVGSRWIKPQQGLFTTSEEFSETFPKSGTMRDGKLYQRRKSVPAISGTGCGLWPTARQAGHKGAASIDSAKGCLKRGFSPNLPEAVQLTKAGLWPTPNCSSSTGAGLHGDGGMNLQTAVKWPTPKAGGQRNSRQAIIDKKGGGKKKSSLALEQAVECSAGILPKELLTLEEVPAKYRAMFPTPTNSMMTIGDMEQAKHSGNGGTRPTYIDASKGQGDGSLNPDWVEWLQGWPVNWSSLEPITELQWLDISTDPHPEIPRVTTAKKNRTNRLKAIGNGQVPAQAAMAWRLLSIE